MDLESFLKARRSVRYFTNQLVRQKDINLLLKAAIWAPSSLNNQPWRFQVILQKDKRKGLANFTKYGYIIKGAPVSICVFLDKQAMYNREKDIMAIGACIQNMLLQAHALNLGSCWLGEILNKKEKVQKFLNVSADYEFMAIISFGYPKEKQGEGSRKKMKSFVLD